MYFHVSCIEASGIFALRIYYSCHRSYVSMDKFEVQQRILGRSKLILQTFFHGYKETYLRKYFLFAFPPFGKIREPGGSFFPLSSTLHSVAVDIGS